MKKILFISTSNLNPYFFSGDTIRAINIIKLLRKKNIVDTISIGNKNKITQTKISDKKNNDYIFKSNNFLLKIFFSIKSLLFLKPIQFGFFFSKKIKEFVEKNYKNYDTIICHLNRSTQYLPSDFKGNKILEMTDLESNNYNQRKKYLRIYNPLYFLYVIEYFLIKSFEKNLTKIFDKIILVSKKDCSKKINFLKKKIKIISNGVNSNKYLYRFNKKNNKIIFIGNINYLPNKDACMFFAKKILPKLNRYKPFLKFQIIGNINFLNKLSFLFLKNVQCVGSIKKLERYIKNSICGLSNLRVATGVQNKILTYGSFGMPIICSLKSIQGLSFLKNNKDVIIYKNNDELIKKINFLISNVKFANKISKNIYFKTKDMSWNKILKSYQTII